MPPIERPDCHWDVPARARTCPKRGCPTGGIVAASAPPPLPAFPTAGSANGKDRIPSDGRCGSRRAGRALLKVIRAAGIGLMVLMLHSCGGPARPAVHAVSSERLQKAMKELDRLSSAYLDPDVYYETSASVDMGKVQAAAAAMATAAADIPEALKTLTLNEEKRASFLKLAEELRGEARDLAEQAGRNDLPQARATMKEIAATCDACHTTFRLRK